MGQVTIWHMTEEERLAYIAKHPIVSTERPKGSTFAETEEQREKRKIARERRWGNGFK